MWNELEHLIVNYQQLNLQEVVDYEKFSMISVMWHSTKIEGCALSETDTRVLIEHDITAKGKPLKDHFMLKDHYAAFQFIKEQAVIKTKPDIDFIRHLGAMVMKNTGEQVNTVLGSFDTSKGDLRLVQVYVDKKYFPNHTKVPSLLEEFSSNLNERIDTVRGTDILKLAADVHYNFVNIHPFGDGNGRTARLLMNYVQMYHNQPFIKIFTEDRVEYIESLNETEAQQNPDIFRAFIAGQQIKFLKSEIELFNRSATGRITLF